GRHQPVRAMALFDLAGVAERSVARRRAALDRPADLHRPARLLRGRLSHLPATRRCAMSERHEPHRVDAPALHKLAGIFLLIFVLILWLMHVLWRHVHPGALTTRPLVIPPQPRLQVTAPEDRHAQYAAQARQLNSY